MKKRKEKSDHVHIHTIGFVNKRKRTEREREARSVRAPVMGIAVDDASSLLTHTHPRTQQIEKRREKKEEKNHISYL